jgi:hypothetical protein
MMLMVLFSQYEGVCDQLFAGAMFQVISMPSESHNNKGEKNTIMFKTIFIIVFQ